MTKSFHALAFSTALLAAACGGGECYVGVRGTAASITVKGLFPGRTCDALIANPVKYVGDLAEDSKDLYSMSDRPTQPVVCEYTVDGSAFVVRDEGMLKVVGNILCSGLGKRADKR
jgi:hypothetical protein